MDWDDVRPKPRAVTLGEPLQSFSLGDLEERIAALRAEIARVEAEIAAKRAHGQAAATLFKK